MYILGLGVGGNGTDTCRVEAMGHHQADPALGERSAAGWGLGHGIKLFCLGEGGLFCIRGVKSPTGVLGGDLAEALQSWAREAGDAGSSEIPGIRLPQIAWPQTGQSPLPQRHPQKHPALRSQLIYSAPWQQDAAYKKGGLVLPGTMRVERGAGEPGQGEPGWGRGLRCTPRLPPASAPIPAAMARRVACEAEG